MWNDRYICLLPITVQQSPQDACYLGIYHCQSRGIAGGGWLGTILRLYIPVCDINVSLYDSLHGVQSTCQSRSMLNMQARQELLESSAPDTVGFHATDDMPT